MSKEFLERPMDGAEDSALVAERDRSMERSWLALYAAAQSLERAHKLCELSRSRFEAAVRAATRS